MKYITATGNMVVTLIFLYLCCIATVHAGSLDNPDLGVIVVGSAILSLLLIMIAVRVYYFCKRKRRVKPAITSQNQQATPCQQGAPSMFANTTRHSASETRVATTQVAQPNVANTSSSTPFSRSTAPSIPNEFVLFLPANPQVVHALPASSLPTATQSTISIATRTNIGPGTHSTHGQPISTDQPPCKIGPYDSDAPPSYESLFPNNG